MGGNKKRAHSNEKDSSFEIVGVLADHANCGINRDGSAGNLRSVDSQEFRDAAQQAKAIGDFRVAQKRWIMLSEVADLYAELDARLKRDEKEEIRACVLISLLDAARAGKFAIDGRSRLFRAHPRYEIEQRWLDDPDQAPPKAFVARDELRRYLSVPNVDPNGRDRREYAVAGSIIANCCVPVRMAVDWLRSREPTIAPPASWLAAAPTASEPREELRREGDGSDTQSAVPARSRSRRGEISPYEWKIRKFVYAAMNIRGDFETKKPGWSRADLIDLILPDPRRGLRFSRTRKKQADELRQEILNNWILRSCGHHARSRARPQSERMSIALTMIGSIRSPTVDQPRLTPPNLRRHNFYFAARFALHDRSESKCIPMLGNPPQSVLSSPSHL